MPPPISEAAKKHFQLIIMKYLTFITLLTLFTACGEPNPGETATNNISAIEGVTERQKIEQDAIEVEKNTVPAEAEKLTGGEVKRGTFMYFADAASFTECGTGDKYNVAGDAYIDLEKKYLQSRTKDMEKIYVEVKGVYGMDTDMSGKEVKTLMADEIITLDPAKSCN